MSSSYSIVFWLSLYHRRHAGGKSAPRRLHVPKITISLPPGEEGKESPSEGEGGYGWAPEIPFVDLTESERQLERKVSLDFGICFIYIEGNVLIT